MFLFPCTVQYSNTHYVHPNNEVVSALILFFDTNPGVLVKVKILYTLTTTPTLPLPLLLSNYMIFFLRLLS